VRAVVAAAEVVIVRDHDRLLRFPVVVLPEGEVRHIES